MCTFYVLGKYHLEIIIRERKIKLEVKWHMEQTVGLDNNPNISLE